MSTPSSRFFYCWRVCLIGVVLLVFGSGPLLVILILAELGMISDPNPNPVGFSCLAALTFWPGVALTTIGFLLGLSRRKHRHRAAGICTACGYELGPAPLARCPECGAWQSSST